MTFDQLVDKWQGPIGAWAIEKGWIKQERDPDHPDKMRTIPRDMLGLMMLMVTELAELEAGLRNEDEANIREEVADFAIRAIQMRAEYGFTCKQASAPPVWEGCQYLQGDGMSLYAMVADAAEAWRRKDSSDDEREVGVWFHLSLAIITAACDNSPDIASSEESVLIWLDRAISDKMERNSKRPYMHDKRA